MIKVLIVEDDNILGKAFQIALTDAGLTSDWATDGDEALKKLKKEKPDMVLLDLLLPKMSGEEVLTAMKKDRDLKDIPVLVSTVKNDSETISRCVALGIRGYFIKAEYTLAEIVQKVKTIADEIKKK